MTSKLPLAPGSRWDETAIIDTHGVRHRIFNDDLVPYIESDGCPSDEIYAQDAIALAHSEGLLPELDELEKLRAAARELTAYCREWIWPVGRILDEQLTAVESLLPGETSEQKNDDQQKKVDH